MGNRFSTRQQQAHVVFIIVVWTACFRFLSFPTFLAVVSNFYSRKGILWIEEIFIVIQWWRNYISNHAVINHSKFFFLVLAYKNAPATKGGSLLRMRSIRDDGVDGTNKDPCRREIANSVVLTAQEGSWHEVARS